MTETNENANDFHEYRTCDEHKQRCCLCYGKRHDEGHYLFVATFRSVRTDRIGKVVRSGGRAVVRRAVAQYLRDARERNWQCETLMQGAAWRVGDRGTLTIGLGG